MEDKTVQDTGTNQQTQGKTPAKTPKSKWVALLLCFFLGVLGAHKFYEGKIGMGVLYIFTGGLLGIGVIVDFVRLCMAKNPYYV